MEDFPHAEPLEIEFAAKLANRIIVQDNQLARRKKRCVSPLERWNGGKGAA